jgi:hypothetical protein
MDLLGGPGEALQTGDLQEGVQLATAHIDQLY